MRLCYQGASIFSHHFYPRKGTPIKIIQLTLTIGQGDLERKLKQAQGFLQKQEQVRITLALRGRQKSRPEAGVIFLTKLHEEFLESYGRVAKLPTAGNLSLTYNPLGKR